MGEHDQRFKRLLMTFFPELMQLFFPQHAQGLDLGHIDWLDKEIVAEDPTGEPLMIDLVARVQRQAEGRPSEEPAVIVYVEIESRDSVAAFRPRMYRYYERLRQKYTSPVLPIAVYLRVGLDGLGTDVYTEALDELEVLRFQYRYVGLPALDAEHHVRGDNWLGVALSALMRSPRERRVELGGEALRRLAQECPESFSRREMLFECVQAYLDLDEQQRQAFERLLQSEPYQEVQTMNVTTFERGREQGIKEGIAKGQRQVIRLLLEQKFGSLSEDAIQRLNAWPADRLTELLPAINKASSLAELGLADS